MPNIALQSRLIIDNSTKNQDLLSLIQTSYTLLQSEAFHAITRRRLMTWAEYKASFPQALREINEQIQEVSKYYLNRYKHQQYDISGIVPLTFNSYKIEVYDTDTESINKHKLSLYFYSQQYELINSFGNYILLKTAEQ